MVRLACVWPTQGGCSTVVLVVVVLSVVHVMLRYSRAAFSFRWSSPTSYRVIVCHSSSAVEQKY